MSTSVSGHTCAKISAFGGTSKCEQISQLFSKHTQNMNNEHDVDKVN